VIKSIGKSVTMLPQFRKILCWCETVIANNIPELSEYNSIKHGPTTFDLRAILQKRDNLRATSNKMIYKTTCSQHLKLKREDK